jgi:hypothetical protein
MNVAAGQMAGLRSRQYHDGGAGNQHLPGAGSGGVAPCDAAAIRSADGPFLNAE